MTSLRVGEETRRLMIWDDRLADELRIVSMLSVDRSMADMYYAQEHMHVESWWIDKKMYHTFMLLLFLEFEQEEPNFWKRIKDKGRELIKQNKLNNERLEKNGKK